ESDPGVSAGRLQDGLVPAQLARGFRGLDHRPGDPVLDRPPGIEVFELGPDLDLRVGTQAPEPDKRSVANEIECAGTEYGSFHNAERLSRKGPGRPLPPARPPAPWPGGDCGSRGDRLRSLVG